MAKICLISHNSSGAFRGDADGHIGGVERQTRLLAHYLASNNHEVSVVVWHESGEKDWKDSAGVQMLGTCEPDAGIRWLRFLAPRWTSLCSALQRADADVYYHNAAEVETGQIALWCKVNRKSFIYSVASEPACERSLRSLNGFVEKTFYKAGLAMADSVIAQTSTQQQKLKNSFGRESVVLPMPCELPENVERSRPIDEKPLRVVWVGRLVPLKRLEMLLSVAESKPGIEFVVIAPENERTTYSRELIEWAKKIPNVEFTGRLPFDDVWNYYRSASLLVCTSEYEGFPNTFLESMACHVPIISTFDPGAVIEKHRLGMTVADDAELSECLQALSTDQQRLLEYSINAYRYFNENHLASVALPRFEQLLLQAGN